MFRIANIHISKKFYEKLTIMDIFGDMRLWARCWAKAWESSRIGALGKAVASYLAGAEAERPRKPKDKLEQGFV